MTSKIPEPGPHVFRVHAECTIAAPAADVWAVLLDTANYVDWNPFVRSFRILDASGAELPPGTLPRAGHKLVSRVNLPPKLAGTGGQALKFDITHFDHDAHVARWESSQFPKWFLSTGRWIALTEIEEEDGSKRTVYESMEAFGRFGAYLVKWFTGAKVQRGFEAMAQALKERVERSVPRDVK